MEERFLSKVDKNGAGGCWNWTGCLSSNRYGCFGIDGKIVRAHRVAYELWVGAIPDGLLIRHKCKQNPKCVNPDHLETGTHQDNMNDMKRDKTYRYFPGVTNGCAKLNETSVREIRRLYALNNISYKQLAEQFNVGKSTIARIVTNQKWTHIT